MLDLIQRLFWVESNIEEHIDVDVFHAMLSEYLRGRVSATNMVDFWLLDHSAKNQLENILAWLIVKPKPKDRKIRLNMLHDVNILLANGFYNNAINQYRILGILV